VRTALAAAKSALLFPTSRSSLRLPQTRPLASAAGTRSPFPGHQLSELRGGGQSDPGWEARKQPALSAVLERT
jgi:hypothetical protein